MCSCTAKRKLTETSVSNTEKLVEAQVLQTQKQHAESFRLGTDSITHNHFVKLYPKGNFVFNKDGFHGLADSLIWYGNAQQVSKYQQLKKQNQYQSNSINSTQVEKQRIKDHRRRLTKPSISVWWIFGCGIVLVLTLHYYRKVRLF